MTFTVLHILKNVVIIKHFNDEQCIVTYYQVCANILENAKEVFQSKVDQAKKVIRGKSPGQVWK